MVDPLVAKGFPGWCSRVVRVCRSDFGPLAKLAAVPAALTAGYLTAINLVRLGPDEIRARVAAASAAAGGQISTDAAVGIVLGRMLPVMAVFGLLILLAMPLVQGAGLFTVVRRANGQFAPLHAAVRFALPRMARLVGWMFVAGFLIAAVAVVPLLAGYLAQSRPLFTAGKVLGTALVLVLGGSVYSALLGVVLVEGKGLGRCRELLRGRLLATGARMLVAGAIYWAYQQVSEWLVAGVAALVGPGLVASLVAGVVTIPALVLQIAVAVVTYAELRGREDGTVGTGGLAAGLVERRSGSVGAVSFDGPTATAFRVARRRRWAGFRWVTPVLVAALAVGAGGPGAFDAAAADSVVPVAAVSPVPASPGDGPGGGSGGDSAGAEPKPAVSGSSDSGSDNGGGGSGSDAPKVASGPDSSTDGDDGGNAGGESGPEVSGRPDMSRPEADATGGADPKPEQPRNEVTAPDAGQGDLAAGNNVGAAAPPPGDPAASGPVAGAVAGSDPPAGQADPVVAGSAPATGAQQGSQIGAAPTPPGADPANPNPGVAGGPAPPVNPQDPNTAATEAEVNLTCPSPASCGNPNDAAEAAESTAAAPQAPTTMEVVHANLDVIGAFPGAGEWADAVNTVAYLAEGDLPNAGISALGAFPILGEGAKASRILGKSTDVLDAERAARVARMTPAERASLEKRAAGADLGDTDYSKTVGSPPAARTPNSPDAGPTGRDRLGQGDAAVPPTGPARSNTGPGEPPPGEAQALDPNKPRADLVPVGDFADDGKAFEHYFFRSM